MSEIRTKEAGSSARWAVGVRPAPFGIGENWHVIEQHGYADATDSIETLDLLCSGFHPDHARDHTAV